ncbi:hypothetical protein ACFSHT_20905 [Paraburkholderia silviterrae]|uniref:Uncharacterized protein n=1 Tax=Paraburkholderia silviterrae TaxID=2528715 RepID=A0A4R5M088_9BURK|nr:hypothetical protein [Paraburkholderia silviterrae]TDG18189.1 hypothetical protein EYW47_35415 [Paraburkholderia silviterrae]
MSHALEIDLLPGQACRLYFEWEYFHEYDALPGRRALSNEEKNRQRERDKDLFLTEYYANYDWGPYRWSQPEFEARNLLWLIEQIDLLGDNRPAKSNAELEAVLKNAVSEGWLIPEIEPEYQSGLYAPLAERTSTTPGNDGILASVESFESSRSAPLRRGEPVLSGPYDPSAQEAKLNAARGMSSSTGGAADDSGFDPLGDAQPFEYRPAKLSDDATELAARGLTGTEEAECDAIYDAEMIACSAAAAMYRDPRTYALCKQRAFQNYQACRGYS